MTKCAFCGKKIGVFQISHGILGQFCSKECEKKFEITESSRSIEDIKPLIEFKGTNGIIGLYEKFIRIDRGTTMGFLIHGLKGKKDIYFKNITSIQIKRPGLTAGYIQFSLPGGIEARGGVFNAVSDENTVSFNGEGDYKKALEIKEYIEKANSSSEKSIFSDANEIEKFHDLMKKGIITEKEFNQKKKKIIGS